RNQFDRLFAVGGLGDHLDALGQRQQGTDALADQGLVVDEADADHRVTPATAGARGAGKYGPLSSGSRNSSSKPSPGAVLTSTWPPQAESRSRMPRSPLPGSTTSAPRPLSRASRRTARPS